MERINNDASQRELRIERILDAPIELVWEVWTDPEHIKNWWGPDGFTTTIHKMDLREGGEWLLTLHGPDQKDYPNRSVFIEVIPLKKIVFQHYNPNFVATIKFTAQRDRTITNWHMLFETRELFEAVVQTFKADEGMKQNMEKLSQYLLRFK